MEPQITTTNILVGSLLPQRHRDRQPAAVELAGPRARHLRDSLVAELIVIAIQGGWVPINVATGIVGVLVASQVMYATLWKPSGIAPAIERATSSTR